MIQEETIKKFDELEVDRLYQEGKSYAWLEKNLHISGDSVHQYLLIKHIPIRKRYGGAGFNPEAPEIGKKYGQWTVVDTAIKKGNLIRGTKDRNIYWLVQCTCGNLSWKGRAALLSGRTTRCKKCANKQLMKLDGETDQINTVIMSTYNRAKQGIPTRRHRGNRKPLTFELDPKYLEELYEKQNHKCALSGISLEPNIALSLSRQNMSIDRIDSFEGYTNDNVQLVDKRINMMKGSLSNEEFIKLCTLVADYNRKCDEEQQDAN